MAITFQTTYETVMSVISRPTTETAVLTMAKREVNNAILFLQRHHSFALAEELSELTYAAGAQSTAITGLRSVLSAQVLSSTGSYEGKPLRVFTYSQLQARRLQYFRTLPAGHDTTFDTPSDLTDELSLESAFRRDVVGFVVANKFGLYPRPTVETRILLHRSLFLAELSGTSDTNFLLDYAFDVVVKLAVRSMRAYLRFDSSYAISDAEVQMALDALVRWDTQLRDTPMNLT